MGRVSAGAWFPDSSSLSHPSTWIAVMSNCSLTASGWKQEQTTAASGMNEELSGCSSHMNPGHWSCVLTVGQFFFPHPRIGLLFLERERGKERGERGKGRGGEKETTM